MATSQVTFCEHPRANLGALNMTEKLDRILETAKLLSNKQVNALANATVSTVNKTILDNFYYALKFSLHCIMNIMHENFRSFFNAHCFHKNGIIDF